ncbi:SAM-dependent methyltransferase [Kiloniella spongiae]|uniref:SAM-dependent methyltransferase n=1 Tax=Kiloniella spongiae TaxID=1489064 RepID=A0A0H2MDM9_9PROT|nr:class I SAM-dependent methyltransferase [Kiloniella spongiae]KLN60458.1 SAM-dependent methyltransferase [Kiloniella spongiae]
MTTPERTSSPEAPSAKFWNKMADRYSKSPVSNQAAYEKKLEITQSYFTPDMEVLELGCGTGTTALIHAPFVKHIHAVDISEKMLEIARDKAAKQNVTNVTFAQAAIDTFIAPDQSYDIIMTHSVLHLLEDKEATIANIHKMLKPGGYFISSTVCLTGIMRFLQLIVPIGRLFGFMPLVKFFSTKHLEKSIANTGFKIISSWEPQKSHSVFIVARKIP